jgi:hypothetical protein
MEQLLREQRAERAVLLRDQRPIGRAAVNEAHGHAFPQLGHVGGIEKDLHGILPN